jgi:hypothetical protein
MAGLERRRRRAPVQSVKESPLTVSGVRCRRCAAEPDRRTSNHIQRKSYVRASRSAAILMVAKVENVSEIA